MSESPIRQPFGVGTFAVATDLFPGLVIDDRVHDLRPQFGETATVAALLDDWEVSLPRLQALADSTAVGGIDLDRVRPVPPVFPPRQIFQSGANYRTHVLDLLDAAERRADRSDGLDPEAREQMRAQLDDRARDGQPFVFLGSAHAAVGACDDIHLPPEGVQHDWELELAAVIGKRARRVPERDALKVVAGYTICNDITTRDALNRADASALGLDWLAGKNAPTFLPVGPYIVPAAHIRDPMSLRVTLKVNGQTMQDESTADMLFGVARIVSYISHVAELRPGDLVLTGSPAGNGASHGRFLSPGDKLHGEITGLGAQRNLCIAEPLEVGESDA